MKKKYIKPQAETILFRAPVVMLGGSNTVQDFVKEDDTYLGDPDY